MNLGPELTVHVGQRILLVLEIKCAKNTISKWCGRHELLITRWFDSTETTEKKTMSGAQSQRAPT